LRQLLIQWEGNEVEAVLGNASIDIALGNAPLIWARDKISCLTSLDISYYDFLSVSKDSSIPVIAKPIENQVNHIM
jgi:hypothetical protein